MKRVVYSSTEPYKEYYRRPGHGIQYAIKGEVDRETGRMWLHIYGIHPYDEQEYVEARVSGNGQVIFERKGKIQDKMQLHSYEPEDYEIGVDEYFNDCIDYIVVELIHMNRDIESMMSHY